MDWFEENKFCGYCEYFQHDCEYIFDTTLDPLNDKGECKEGYDISRGDMTACGNYELTRFLKTEKEI